MSCITYNFLSPIAASIYIGIAPPHSFWFLILFFMPSLPFHFGHVILNHPLRGWFTGFKCLMYMYLHSKLKYLNFKNLKVVYIKSPNDDLQEFFFMHYSSSNSTRVWKPGKCKIIAILVWLSEETCGDLLSLLILPSCSFALVVLWK